MVLRLRGRGLPAFSLFPVGRTSTKLHGFWGSGKSRPHPGRVVRAEWGRSREVVPGRRPNPGGLRDDPHPAGETTAPGAHPAQALDHGAGTSWRRRWIYSIVESATADRGWQTRSANDDGPRSRSGGRRGVGVGCLLRGLHDVEERRVVGVGLGRILLRDDHRGQQVRRDDLHAVVVLLTGHDRLDRLDLRVLTGHGERRDVLARPGAR